MKYTALLALLAASAASAELSREKVEELFFEHIQKFDVAIKDGTDFVKRLETFIDNLKYIEEHNANEKKTFTMGMGPFTHLSHDEWKKQMNFKLARPNLRSKGEFYHGEPSNMKDTPTSVDWVSKGAVTAVKNQGQCGSCWSFSTTGSMEGAYFIKNGKMPSSTGFSEQNLVSCDTVDSACNGGLMDNAFKWIKTNGGLATEADYPYVSGNGNVPTCNSGIKTVSLSPSYTDVQEGSVSAMMSAVAKQPVSIAIQANQRAFQHYTGGVLTSGCGQRLDHGVLNTGYGTEDGTDYWNVKNSWGPSWGDKGYIKILRDDSNQCGVLSAASYPNL
jgi:C1A family cysteine protease